MEGILLAALLLAVGAGVFIAVRYIQRELGKLTALAVKGERFHADRERRRP